MNFFVFLRLGIIKTKKEEPALSKQSKIMIFECEVKFYLTHKMNPYNCLDKDKYKDKDKVKDKDKDKDNYMGSS